jgi:hypothetical protein
LERLRESLKKGGRASVPASPNFSEAAGTVHKAVADPRAFDLAALNQPQRKALIRFWEAWQEDLKRPRILAPACGSGAIPIQAFDQFHAV